MSNRLVKCKKCGEKNKQKDSYKHIHNGKNEYFCSEQHFKIYYEDKENRKQILDMCDDLFQLKVSKDTFFLKELKEYQNHYKELKYLLEDMMLDLDVSLSKNFNSLNFKIRYFFAIVKKEIDKYKYKVKQENVKYKDLEITNTNYKCKNKKKTILEIIEEVYDANR